MAKEIQTFIKLQVKGGQANPAPPIGPALGSKGVNIMEFCKRFNAQTQDKQGKILLCVITVYTDKSFDFIIKKTPMSVMIKKVLGLEKGSGTAGRGTHATMTRAKAEEIAKEKMDELKTKDLAQY